MSELNDHLKLLYARAARLFCSGCGEPVRRDTPDSIADDLERRLPEGTRLQVCFRVPFGGVPGGVEAVRDLLAQQGYVRVYRCSHDALEMVQDRLRLRRSSRSRLVEALEGALRQGQGRIAVVPVDADGHEDEPIPFSADLHCAVCDRHYRDPIPNLFSFNSPVGACEHCRGFGRSIEMDPDLVVPDAGRSLAAGAVKPFQSPGYRECQDDLIRFARKRKVPVDLPWHDLSPDDQRWVFEGDGSWEDGHWYGVNGFFRWMESKRYKMHVRVLLSRYRAYHTCTACGGARLNPEARCWRLGDGPDALALHQLARLPIADCARFFDQLRLDKARMAAVGPLLEEIRSRLRFLLEVGLDYLTLDRQSRTLSGGEVQRIHLTTALGSTLVNTLFVLDEPSIGLHPRDTGRLIGVLRRLRDAGNTLLVVEHDPEIIRAADRVIDMGPGAGRNGGTVVCQGTPIEVAGSPVSRTGAYLRGENRISRGLPWLPPPCSTDPHIELLGVRANNLHDLDIRIPLGRLVAVSGVSGSGKSTLLETVLYRGLLRRRGMPTDPPGECRLIRGDDVIGEVILMDQHPIGRTARSNPVTYIGAWTPIRACFAALPEARERGFKAGAFSFNAGKRCAACGGTGVQQVEMQFLSDMHRQCPECDGKRFEPDLLEIRLQWDGAPPKSVADVLEMTVDDASGYFSKVPAVRHALEPLRTAGLGYLRLGQPLPTLSGGEAQRLKLAERVAHASSTDAKPALFLLDEPTTGLHVDDVAVLLKALRALVAKGHTVVMIEHHLDCLRAADWILDLGPEGGGDGGRLVCAGTPDDIAVCRGSHTGAALRAMEHTGNAMPGIRKQRRQRVEAPVARHGGDIRMVNAREHNLRNATITIPRDQFTVITGLSGSGKSTVAFDILYHEGQRRYLESLNAYARQFVQPAARPDVDAVTGLPPTVAIEQRISRGGVKSTVATATEIYPYLRLLFVKLGVQHCPDCGVAIQPQSPERMAADARRVFRGKTVEVDALMVIARKGLYRELAAWAHSRGYRHLRVDGVLRETEHWPRLDRYREHDIALPVGTATVTPKGASALDALMRNACLAGGNGQVRVSAPGCERVYSASRSCPGCGRGFPDPDPRYFSFHSRRGWCPRCFGTGLELRGFDGEQTGEETAWESAGADGAAAPCKACDGRRLCPDALAVKIHGYGIDALTAMTVDALRDALAGIRWPKADAPIASVLKTEMDARLQFLQAVGLGYLSLDRAAPTLSGGEAQRIRLAAQLGSNLQGVCYVLDEPTIGLHARDHAQLLDTLRRLQRKGNTVVVVEHDADTIRGADHIIDLGPGAGVLGGAVVASGTPDAVMQHPESVTGRCLRHPMRHPMTGRRRPCTPSSVQWLTIRKADLHNLRKITVKMPLGRLVCVTGVSGSGKSTLVRDVLLQTLIPVAKNRKPVPSVLHPRGCEALEGAGSLRRMIEVDQTPIGRTPRSCPATYVGFWDQIRDRFAATPEARMRGYDAGRFSFNTADGRCPECAGNGYQTLEMSFLPDVHVRCDACGGARFTEETRQVTYQGLNIAEVLALSVDQAVGRFKAIPPVYRALRLLQDVGLGYLSLGQRSPTLSGGEAQRIKLVTELARNGSPGNTLYVLDEPTIGLHMGDVEPLLRVLHRLVDAGASVVVIEHNLDVIAEADWVVDLGPGGGSAGGRVVGAGPPERLARVKSSATAPFLARVLAQPTAS